MLVDCSSGGLRIASHLRLSPGRRCTIVWPLLRGCPVVEGVVARSWVGKVVCDRPVVYEAGIALEAPGGLPWEQATRS